MFNLITKKQREEYRNACIKMEVDKGATREDYNELTILKRTVEAPRGTLFYLTIYTSTAARPIVNEYYRDEQRRDQKATETKKGHDMRKAYKEEQKKKGKHVSHQAQAAAAIREELKKKFPSIKFSVTSKGYSMGDNVNVRYEDGPTIAEVEEITSKYQSGHFDGMNDIYEYSNTREDIPQTKYLFVTRNKSEQTKKAIAESAPKFWQGDTWQDEQSRDRCVYEVWSKTSLPAGAIVKGFKWEGHDIILEFEAPNQPATATEAPSFEKQEVKAGTVQIIDYSEKAIAVIGDTRPIKDKLASLGGKFNPRLSCGPGWIFSKTRISALQEAFKQQEPEQAPEPEEIPEEPTPEEAEAIEQEERAIMIVDKAETAPRFPHLEAAHPLNICDPQSSQYKEALNEYADEQSPSETTTEARSRLKLELEKTADFLGLREPAQVQTSLFETEPATFNYAG